MKTIFIILISTLTFTFVRAQDTTAFKPLTKFPVFSIYKTNYGDSKFKNDTEGKLRYSSYSGSLQMAFPLIEKKRYLLHKLDFTALKIENRNIEDSITNTANFYSYTYNIGLIEVLKKNWSLVGLLSPTLASDFKRKLSHEDFIMQASVIASKRVNRYWEYGFGLSYNTRFGRQIVVPLALMNYKKNKWSVNIVLPAFVAGFYHMKNSKVGISISILGNTYNYKESVTIPVDLDKVGYTRFTFGPQYEVKLYKAFYVNAFTGIAFNNILQSITKDDEIGLDLSTKANVFGRLGIVLKL